MKSPNDRYFGECKECRAKVLVALQARGGWITLQERAEPFYVITTYRDKNGKTRSRARSVIGYARHECGPEKPQDARRRDEAGSAHTD